MRKQLLSVLCILLLLSPKAQAEGIGYEQALEVAVRFYEQQIPATRSFAKAELKLAYKALPPVKQVVEEPYYYVFNASGGNGFVIVSAEDRTYPILGYTDTGTFDYAQMPDALKWLVAGYENQVKAVRAQPQTGGVTATEVTRAWNGLRRTAAIAYEAAVEEKLLKTATWRQESPFNNAIPNRRLVGCVGTAMAIIMHYNACPAVTIGGTGSHTNGNTTVTFDGVKYNWGGMRTDAYTATATADQIKEVSQLMYHAAFSIDTNFGLYASSSSERRVPGALTTYFGYDRGVEFKEKREMPDENAWAALIKHEIDANRPVLYAGQDASTGHAFVCDGYNGQDYFHINWGWGGLGDGFFRLTALNPLGNKYNFSSQEGIVFNIKRADAANLATSPLQLTSNDNQVGMTSDTENISVGKVFSIWAGTLRNTTQNAFSGQIAVALTGSDGVVKEIVSTESKITLDALMNHDTPLRFDGCKATAFAETDLLRLVTKTGTNVWKIVGGTLNAPGEVKVKGHTLGHFQFSFPVTSGITVAKTDDKVIKGRSYTFGLTFAAGSVVYAKANGYKLLPVSQTPTTQQYILPCVLSDQSIELNLISAESARLDKTVWLGAGELDRKLTDAEKGTVKNLTLFGVMDARDFAVIRTKMNSIQTLDLSGVSISAYGSDAANAIPLRGLELCKTLQRVILPESLRKFSHNSFNESGLKEIVIPANVVTYEYNLFLNCGGLQKVTVQRATPEFINWCVFTGTPWNELVVPTDAAVAAYKAKDNWKKFKSIHVGAPQPATSYRVILPDADGINAFQMTDYNSNQVPVGAGYRFRLEVADSLADHNLQVMANATVLTPDKSGIYTLSKLSNNTMVHVNLEAPISATVSKRMKLSGIGLITETTNVVRGNTFKVRINTLKVAPEYADSFVAMALTDKNGNIKEFISAYEELSRLGKGGIYTFVCSVKKATVQPGNLIRLVVSDGVKWGLVEGELTTIDRIQALEHEIAYQAITMPQSLEKAGIENYSDRVVRGMDYSFAVRSYLSSDVVDIYVNGTKVVDRQFNPSYTVANVQQDITIAVSVYDKDLQKPYLTLSILPGTLESALKMVTDLERLRLVGEMDMRDFDILQKQVSGTCKALDLSDVKIVADAKNPADVIPMNAFKNSTSAIAVSAYESIILPNTVTTIKASAFYRCHSLVSITFPAAVTSLGTNLLVGLTKLEKVTVKNPKPISLNNNIITGGANIMLSVPKGSLAAYQKSFGWKDFARFEEFTEIYSISLPVIEGVTVNPLDGYNENKVVAGKEFKFKLTVADAKQIFEVRVGTNVLTPDANGIYTINEVKSNLVIEVVRFYQVAYTQVSDVELIPVAGYLPDLVRAGDNFLFGLRTKIELAQLKVKVGEVVLLPIEGVYTLQEVRKNEMITVSLELPENPVLTGESLALVDKEEAKRVNKITLSGPMDADDFALLKETFTSVETIDLQKIESEVLPTEAFKNMQSLKSIELPEALNTIGVDAFSGCTHLGSVVLRPNVTTVGDGAFSGCESLTHVVIFHPAVNYGVNVFFGANPNCLYLQINSQQQGQPQLANRAVISRVAGIPHLLTAESDAASGGYKATANVDIHLLHGHPYASPARVTMGNGKKLTLSRERNSSMQTAVLKWFTACLPFDIAQVTVGNRVTALDACQLAKEAATDEEELMKVTQLLKNTPYLLTTGSTTGEVIFEAVANAVLDVTATIYPSLEGRRYDMRIAYTTVAQTDSVYPINEAGDAFISNLRAVRPFEAYAVNKAGVAEGPDSYRLPESLITSNHLAQTTPITLYVHRGCVMVRVDQAGFLDVYSIDGRLIHRASLVEGLNEIRLPAGTYVIGRQKVVL